MRFSADFAKFSFLSFVENENLVKKYSFGQLLVKFSFKNSLAVKFLKLIGISLLKISNVSLSRF